MVIKHSMDLQGFEALLGDVLGQGLGRLWLVQELFGYCSCASVYQLKVRAVRHSTEQLMVANDGDALYLVLIQV